MDLGILGLLILEASIMHLSLWMSFVFVFVFFFTWVLFLSHKNEAFKSCSKFYKKNVQNEKVLPLLVFLVIMKEKLKTTIF